MDESIKDPVFAEKLAQTWLADLGTTRTEIRCHQTYGDVDLSKVEVGKLVGVEMPSEGVSGSFVLQEVKYHFVPHAGLEADYLLGDPPSPYQLQIKSMMKEIERLKKRGTDPDTNFDVWNRFYATVATPSGSIQSQESDVLKAICPVGLDTHFPYDFPFLFSGTPVCSLTITES